MGSPGGEGDSASIQLWWVPAAAGPAWVNGDTKKFLAAVMARRSVDLHGVKTPPMAGQSCSNNANNAAAKFQVFPKFILSILMESPGLEPVSVVSIVHFHQSIFFCFSSSGLQGGGWSLSQLSEGKRCTVAGIMQR